MYQPVYFLPGHGQRISNSLGQELCRRSFEVVGRETVGDFKKLSFEVQVETVAHDLKANFWYPDALVLANSYGAYLLLQALSLSKPFPGKALLLSPIVGEFSNEKSRIGFIPPYARRLYELTTSGQFPVLEKCEIHVGSEDWQSIPDDVVAFASMVNAKVAVLKDAGHSLPKEYVSAVLDRWLVA